jgi:hypothetical protein
MHLARKVFVILKLLLFSDPWIRNNAPKVLVPIDTALATLISVTQETAPTNELRNLWNQVRVWKIILSFLKDPYLLSRWAWVLGVAFLGSAYIYIAVLFSFAYYGIARVSGVPYTWPDAFTTSLFIPFFISNLPKVVALRMLAVFHCLIVVVIGIGTIVNFLRRKLDDIREAATDLSNRLADQAIHDKFIILEEKFSTSPAAVPPATAPSGPST